MPLGALLMVGSVDGIEEGRAEGQNEGALLTEGDMLGIIDGCIDGNWFVGAADGDPLGDDDESSSEHTLSTQTKSLQQTVFPLHD